MLKNWKTPQTKIQASGLVYHVYNINGLILDSSISSALAMEIPQSSYIKPSI